MYDTIIIGAGSGGYSCAIRVAQLGGRVLIIENGEIGGCCTNRGCIPTKALLRSAKLFYDIKNAMRLGIKVENAKVDSETLFKRVDRVVSTTGKGIEQLLKSYGIDIIRGKAGINSPETVIVNNETFKTKNIVIATGSTPAHIQGIKPNGFILNSDSYFDYKKIPASVVILGGGAIGVEFANIFNFLGSKVTIVEMMDRIVPTEDIEVSEELEKVFKRYGITIYTKSQVNILDSKVEIIRDEKKFVLEPEKLLVAIGRKPVFDANELTKNGIDFNEKGIKVTDRMMTTVNNVYAIGDVTGKLMLAHVAIRQGIVAAHNIMGIDATMDYIAVPSCVYSKPEIGSIGLRSQDDASLKTGKFPFIASGKGRTDEEKEGFVKLVSKNNKVVGMHIIGGNATELVGEGSLLINNGINLEKIIGSIHPHPTFSESIIEAVEDITSHAINMLKKNFN